MAWTQQQLDAINSRGSSVIVPAAAGSGKTAVLTERLSQLIADPDSGVRADRMIVVTFTNDAASELKKRLNSKLRALISAAPDDPYLLKQQVLLQNAKISTINSFCFELLRDNITDQGITSGFSVLDESDHKVLRAQAMEELINYFSKNEYDAISYLYDRFCIKNEQRLIEVIELADNFLASAALRDKWLDSAVSGYDTDFFSSIYFKALCDSVIEKLETALSLAESSCSMVRMIFAESLDTTAFGNSMKLAEDDCERIEKILAVFRGGRLPDENEAAELPCFGELIKVGKTKHDKLLREKYKKRRDKMKKLVISVFDSIRSAESDYAESGDVTRLLVRMIHKYHEIIWEKKCARNAISFDDGERLALELLADIDENGHIIQSETAKRTAEYYDIIMIDEYQDSNNKEDLIFKLISRNYKHDSAGEPMYGDNVFLVGDVKQSIYGFRLANPKNFIKTQRSSVPYDAESNAPNKYIVLNKNFRSSKPVIDFVNYVFGQIMTEKCGGVDYTDDEKLYFGAVEYEGKEAAFQTVLNFIDDDPDETEVLLPGKFRKKTNKEAVRTAAQIARMLSDGTPVINKDGTQRTCKPSDFCILVRNNSYINVYAEELSKLGIPVKGSEESGYLKSREIAVLIDLLRIISNPLLDVPMAAVMTSPMYMFTIADIARIKSLDREKPLFSVMKNLADGAYEGYSDMLLAGRCRDFLESIDSFRLSSVTMTLGELIASIYDTTDFISVMQLYSDGDKKRANLRALIQYAKGYEEATAFEGSGGLGGFLRHIDRVIQNGDYAQGKVSASSGDYVVIQTFHASKGLEYPFVWIAETSCGFKYDSKIVMCSDDGRIGYVLYDPAIYRKYKTFQQIMLTEEMKRTTRSEEMRLLYVGLTRAKQKLFIDLKCGEKAMKKVMQHIDTLTLSGGDISEIVSNASSFSDWLWAALLRHKDIETIADELGFTAVIADMPRSQYAEKVYEISSGEIIVEDTKSNVTDENDEKADPAVVAELEKLIGHNYDRTLTEMPSKLSVTQITKKNRPDSDDTGIPEHFLKRPKFRSANGRLTGTERGTAIHTFFQYCDFENAIKSPDDEISRIAEMGYITKPQADSISRQNVAAFFESELYDWIKNADKVWREKKFMVAASQLSEDAPMIEALRSSDGMIKGIIDLMYEQPDGVVIVDYKSDRRISRRKLRERYTDQLKMYKAAIELTTGKKVKAAYLYSFELRDSIEVDIKNPG